MEILIIIIVLAFIFAATPLFRGVLMFMGNIILWTIAFLVAAMFVVFILSAIAGGVAGY